MTEGTQPDTSTGTPDAATSGSQPTGQTVEERDAFWQARMSGKDRAHNAELGQVRQDFEAQIAALRTPAAPPNETPEAARIRELEQQVATEQRARVVTEYRAKYPYAAAMLGDEIVKLSEAKVAALDAGRLDAPTGDQATNGAGFPIIDPNSAPRRPAGMPATKPNADKSIEELEADLRAMTPAYQAALRAR